MLGFVCHLHHVPRPLGMQLYSSFTIFYRLHNHSLPSFLLLFRHQVIFICFLPASSFHSLIHLRHFSDPVFWHPVKLHPSLMRFHRFHIHSRPSCPPLFRNSIGFILFFLFSFLIHTCIPFRHFRIRSAIHSSVTHFLTHTLFSIFIMAVNINQSINHSITSKTYQVVTFIIYSFIHILHFHCFCI